MERLDERARSLAARFTLAPSRHAARSVFPRFDDNVGVLRKAYRVLADDVHRGEFVTSAAEWLLDNFHLVTSEIGDVRQNLPRGYYRELPKLAAREQAGNARVYAIAVELIRHSDSRPDRAQLVRWLDAFQTVAPLTIGELWAWPSMLKLALVENLRRLAQETLVARASRRAADAYVARIDAGGGGVPPPLPPALHPALVVQLLQHVREYGPRLAAVRSALDAHLASERATAEEAVRGEHQREAAAQVSVANVIGSLRLCSTLDWTQYVETVSLVERVLQRDPAACTGGSSSSPETATGRWWRSSRSRPARARSASPCAQWRARGRPPKAAARGRAPRTWGTTSCSFVLGDAAFTPPSRSPAGTPGDSPTPTRRSRDLRPLRGRGHPGGEAAPRGFLNGHARRGIAMSMSQPARELEPA